jgi:replicative DNA helicase
VSDPLDALIYRPADVSALTVAEIEYREKTKHSGVPVNISGGPAKVINPMRGGELITVLGLSSNGKTWLMNHLARTTAKELDSTGNDIVLYVSWEEAVEDMGITDIANSLHVDLTDIAHGNVKDWQAVKTAAIKRGSLPIYVLGHSMERRKSRPKLSMTNVALAVQRLENVYGLRIRLTLLDYLQRIERDGNDDARLQFSRNVDRAKDMAFATGAPVVMGCQAKQEVIDREWKLPQMNDGMETSNTMHSSDKIFSVWRPYITDGDNEVISRDPLIKSSPNLLMLGLPKQKRGDAGMWWALTGDPKTNTIYGEMDTTHLQP